MAQVVLEKLTKVFPGPGRGRLDALKELDLTVRHQELLVLVGPSGSGKTTTLRLIAGFEEPTSGTISIDGQLMNRVPPKERGIAMAFQHAALYPHMSVYENLVFPLRLRKIPKADRARRAREMAELAGIGALLDRMPKALSGGERQRVALARALICAPRVFLLDEPLSSLDPPLRVQLRSEIIQLHRRFGTTMIYVTHDQGEALRLGDRVALLRDGQLQQIAPPNELYQRPANLFAAGFIGSPPMNIFQGMLQARGTGFYFEEKRGGSTAPKGLAVRLDSEAGRGFSHRIGKPVVLGIRPERIRPLPAASEAHPSTIVRAAIEWIEPSGAEVYLHLNSGNHPFAARAPMEFPAREGESIHLAFDMAQAHFFDPESTLRLG